MVSYEGNAVGKERPSKFVLERNGSFKPPAHVALCLVLGSRYQSLQLVELKA
jgi:hypothetical protein